MSLLVRSLLVIVVPVLLSSCSQKRVPFTQQLREKHQLKPEEIKAIQFYISNDLVLRRGDQESKKVTNDGELTLLNDAVMEEVVIKAGTPCLIRDVIDGNQVTVSFEDNGNKFLVFGSLNNRDGYYTLRALDWNKGRGKLSYGEKMYVTSPGSKDVFLVLKLKSLEKFRVDKTIVPGKKL